MRTRISVVMTLVVFAAFAAARADECVIKAVKAASLEASAIGYGGKSPRVVVVQLTLENAGGEPTRLNWKNAVPVLQAEGRRVEASRLLVPNWLPMAGGVGPYATQTSFGGEVITGLLEIDKDTWCRWLAVDKPGAESGDHVSIPVKSVTITVTKEKTVSLKLLFPEDVPVSSAQVIVPGCKPSPVPLGGTTSRTAVPLTDSQPSANDQSTVEKYVVVRCGDIIYRLSVTGSNAPTGTDYKDNEIAVSFPVGYNNALGLEIRNLSAKKLVVHWGSKEIKLRVGDKDKVLVKTFKMGLYNPFLGGRLEELETDMTIEPGKSELVFVGAFELQWGEKLELRQELLPLDATKAQELKGKTMKLTLPMLVNNEETKRTIEFTVKEVSAGK